MLSLRVTGRLKAKLNAQGAGQEVEIIDINQIAPDPVWQTDDAMG